MMKRLEVILKRHDSQMLTHNRLYIKKRTSLKNEKVWNETIFALEEWKKQQCEDECNGSTDDE